ncbi:MAG: PilZ domain-containing protein [Candidatus Omnitrophota bacterium]
MLLGRREHPRLRHNVPIRFGREESNSQDSLTKDLGGGGVRLLSRDFLPVNSKVKIEFFLEPASEALQAVGRVVWVQKLAYSYQHDVGIQFLDISDITRKRISSFVEQNLVVQSPSSVMRQDMYRDYPYTVAL